jgi:hypothetical protein
VVNEEKASAIFLLVNDVKLSPNQSKGCAIIQEAKVEDQTLGIFTKLDTFVSEDGDEVAELAELLQGKARGSFEVKYGWMATSSKKIDSSKLRKTATSELSALYQMSERENEVFQRFSQCPLNCRRLLGIDNIRQRIQHLYEQFIASNWVNIILEKLDPYRTKLNHKSNMLGPLPPDPDYTDLLQNLLTFSFVPVLDTKDIRHYFTHWLQDLVRDSKDIWIRLHTEGNLWEKIRSYHQIFLLPNKSINSNISYNRQVPFENYIQQYQNYTSANYPDFPAPISLPRVVLAENVEETTERIESIVKQLFKEITDVLLSKLQPREEIITILSDAICRYTEGTFNLKRFPKLIERIKGVFKHRLELAYNSMIVWIDEFQAKHLSEPMLFSEYFLDSPQVQPFTFSFGNQGQQQQDPAVRCCLHWSNPALYNRLPHMVLDKFFALIRILLNNLENDITLEDLEENCQVESCKAERMKYLEELVKISQVTSQIKGFATRVQEMTAVFQGEKLNTGESELTSGVQQISFQCSTCNEGFPSRYKLVLHTKTHKLPGQQRSTVDTEGKEEKDY